MPNRNPITGIFEHSWPATEAHYVRLAKMAHRARVHLAISRYTLNLTCVWPGYEQPMGGVERKLGQFPREHVITDMRAYRAASKIGFDPLTISPHPQHRLKVGNRLRNLETISAWKTRHEPSLAVSLGLGGI